MAVFAAVDLSLPQGHAIHVRGLLDALVEKGYRVDLFTPRPVSNPPPVLFHKIEIPIVRYRVLGFWSFEILAGMRLFVHCLLHRPRVIYARQDLYTVAPALVSKLLRIPLVSEVNASIVDEIGIWGRPFVRRLVAACEKFSLKRASAVLVMASPLRGKIAGRVGIDSARIHVLPIGTHLPPEIDPREVRESLQIAPTVFLVGFAGNLSPIQGVDLLIESMHHAQPDEVQLWIIGTGTEERRLREMAAEFGSGIRFFGGVTREESDRLMATCQLLVAPYRRAEYERIYGDWGQTCKILAYLAVNRPILVSDVPSYRWIVDRGLGEIFPSGDAVALSRLIVAWRSRWIAEGSPPIDWPWRFPGPGREFVVSERTWAHVASWTGSIVEELSISEAPRPKSRAR